MTNAEAAQRVLKWINGLLGLLTCKNLSSNSKIVRFLNVSEHKAEITDIIEDKRKFG